MPRFVVLHSPDGLAPLDDVAVGPALLAAAARNESAAQHPDGGDELLRLTRPAPTLSFSRLDTLAPGFPLAAERARAHGFTPVVRGRGGRAAAYHDGCILVDHVGVDPDARMRITARFERTSSALLTALGRLGVDASLGALPGEYCPGEHSISAAVHADPSRRVKVVGTAQRVVRAAWLMSAVVVVDGADALRAVLTDVYDALGLEWDPATTGDLAQAVAPSAGPSAAPAISLDDVRAALLAGYGFTAGAPDEEVGWTTTLLDAARSLADRHALPARP